MYNQNSDLMKQEKFMLPTMIEGDFSAEELAEDADGLQMSFQRVKIPAGGTLQFEMPSDDPDNPDYEKNLVGVILHNHATCAYWPAGSEYDDDTTPLCSSVDGKVGMSCGKTSVKPLPPIPAFWYLTVCGSNTNTLMRLYPISIQL